MTTLATRNYRNQVLVLNKLWSPVVIASTQRAFTLLYSNYDDGAPKAKVIEQVGKDKIWTQFDWSDWSRIKPKGDEDFIRSSHDVFRIPWVILLTKYDQMPDQRINFSRRQIIKRDRHRCQYCGKQCSPDEWTIDHIIPRAYQGKTTWENCITACYKCNSQKANRIPALSEKLTTMYRNQGYDVDSIQVATRPKGMKEFDERRRPEGWCGPSPMKLLSVPSKPKFTLFKNEPKKIPHQWSAFLSQMYFDVELENDNEEHGEDFLDEI